MDTIFVDSDKINVFLKIVDRIPKVNYVIVPDSASAEDTKAIQAKGKRVFTWAFFLGDHSGDAVD